MSRDFRPCETRMASVRFGFSNMRIALTDERGNEKVLYDPDSEAAKRRPLLSELFSQQYVEKQMKLSEKEPWREKVLDEAEAALRAVIDDFEGGARVPEGEPYETVGKWFRGELDPDFHYHERNDAAFEAYLDGLFGDEADKERTPTGVDLKDLVGDGEAIFEYAVEGRYFPCRCVGPKGTTDVGGALEGTLHAILDAGGNSADVYRIMGAEILTEDDQENEYAIQIDLGYGFADALLTIRELPENEW